MDRKKQKELIYDVVVIGGGTSGFAAGVAAAANGAKTLIIEEQAFLGGMATGGMISMFMGFGKDDSLPLRGVAGEMLERLKALDACSGLNTVYLAGRQDMDVHSVTYDSNALKYVLDEMVASSGAEVLFHSRVIAVNMQDEKITDILVAAPEGIVSVKAAVYIDASFHGVAAAMAGVPLQPDFSETELQPGSLMFKMAPVDFPRFMALSREEKDRLVQEGLKEEALFIDNILARPLGYADISFHNMSRVSVNPLTAETWSRAEMTGRRQVQKIVTFLHQRVPGFEKARLISTGDYLGMRDSRRFVGKYTLTGEDVLRGTCFEDAVAANEFPVDIHREQGYIFQKPAAGESYIPFRCMQCSVDNLLLTGRCISADAAAHASLRVMITCIRLGEAAGKAAQCSIQSRTAVRDFDGTTLGRM